MGNRIVDQGMTGRGWGFAFLMLPKETGKPVAYWRSVARARLSNVWQVAHEPSEPVKLRAELARRVRTLGARVAARNPILRYRSVDSGRGDDGWSLVRPGDPV
jgi:hypothetical protein